MEIHCMTVTALLSDTDPSCYYTYLRRTLPYWCSAGNSREVTANLKLPQFTKQWVALDKHG